MSGFTVIAAVARIVVHIGMAWVNSKYCKKRQLGRRYFFLVFDDFSKWRVPNGMQKSEKSSNIAKISGEMKKIFQLFFNGATFGNKNVHSVMISAIRDKCNFIKLHFFPDFWTL